VSHVLVSFTSAILFTISSVLALIPVCRTLDPLAAKKGAGCFPRNSQWPALFDHCVREHPKACEDMERLTPAQIAEMRARMSMRKS
jgi:hypothetical protein